jgi:hypothetical protein
MSLTRLWNSLDRTIRKIADEANYRAEQAGIPDDEEKRLFYFQYIDKEIAKLKEDITDPVGQSRFKTVVKTRAAFFYGATPLHHMTEAQQVSPVGEGKRSKAAVRPKKRNAGQHKAARKEAEV